MNLQYFKSKKFWQILLFYALPFSLLLILPSFWYFTSFKMTILEYFKDKVPDIYSYTRSRNKIIEISPWLVVGITSILIIAGNTFTYFVTFIIATIDSTIVNVAKIFRYLTIFFLGVWLLCFAYFFVNNIIIEIFQFDKELSRIVTLPLSKDVQSSPDLKLTEFIGKTLSEFINNLELYTYYNNWSFYLH